MTVKTPKGDAAASPPEPVSPPPGPATTSAPPPSSDNTEPEGPAAQPPAPDAPTGAGAAEPEAVSTLPAADVWLVVLADDAELGLARGELIGVSQTTADTLVPSGQARAATEAEIELAQPRLRLWNKG